MAELNSTPEKRGSSVRTKKSALKVDLTAMVDLAFLLITFFMLTTTLSKPKAMDIIMPADVHSEPVPQSRTMTICLGKDNKAVWYLGELSKPIIAATITNYSKSGLRRVIMETRQQVLETTGKSMIVVIKPAETSVYENLVDVLDEMNINNIQQFAIANIDKPDLDVLRAKQAF